MANFTERISVIIDTKFDQAQAGFKKFSADIKAADGAANKLKAGWSSAVSSIKANAGTLAAAGGVAMLAFADDILRAGVALEQMDAKAATVFGDSLGTVQDWAAENAAAMGLTERAAVGAGAGIADLLKPMGFTTEAATEQSVALLDLSGALAAWSAGKYDAAQVSEILTKAMLGEREQLKSLGISITEADVSARLLENGQKGLTGAALAQAKAMATQALIMEKSTDAQVAWSDGSMDGVKAANASKAKMGELTEQLTEGLLPVMQELVPAFVDLAAAVEPLVGPMAKLASTVAYMSSEMRTMGNSGAFGSLSDSLDEVAQETDLTTVSLKEMQAFIASSGMTAIEAALAMARWQDAQDDAKRAADDTSTAADDLAEKMFYLANESDTAADKIGAASTATNDLTAAGKDAGPAMDDLRDALDDAAAAGDDLESHLKGVRDILDELDKSDAALDLADQMDDTKKAAEEAFYAGAAGADDFAQKQRDAQREANELKRKVIEYGDSIGGIPADKLTEINALIDAGDVEAVQRELDRLTQARTVTLFLNAVPTGSGSGGGSSGSATGGSGAGNGGGFGKNNLEGVGGARGGVVVENHFHGAVITQDGQALGDIITKSVQDGYRQAWMAGPA